MESLNLHLLTHNILFLLGGLLNVGIAIFAYITTRKRRTMANTMFILVGLSVSVYQFSQLFGVNAPDAVTSRNILMFNLNDILIGIFMAHWFIALIGKAREQRFAVGSIYASGLGLLAFYLLFPRTFLVESVPKMYLPFYYEPGPLYFVMVLWFMCVAIYHFYQLAKAYQQETDPTQKNRFKYVLFAMIYAYALGTTNFLLVFNIPFDPALSSFFGLYPLMLAYAIWKYDLLDIRILAKRAVLYGAVIFTIGVVISSFNFLGSYIREYEPGLPLWAISLPTAVLIGGGGVYIWRKMRDAEIAKYEFITVVTHKFRTPLTRIRWTAEEMAQSLSEAKKKQMKSILQSEQQLVELTDMLVKLSGADTSNFYYKPQSVNVRKLFSEIKTEYAARAEKKEIKLSLKLPSDMAVLADPEKSRFIFQIILDNALNYTPAGGSISITAHPSEDNQHGVIEVADTGIGMSKETASRIFNRFYRGDRARRADTEGIGIGLFMAQSITEKQAGKIWAASPGEGKGSTFFVQLPLALS